MISIFNGFVYSQDHFLIERKISMLKMISYQEIEGKYDIHNSIWGCSAKAFHMHGEFQGHVYKNYLRPILQNQMTSRGITYLEHLTNLSEIQSEEMMSTKFVVVNPLAILGIIMKKAPGKLLVKQDVSIEQVMSSNNNIREGILDISSHFEIFDLNEGSIFYSQERGTTLVDLESYMESDSDNTHKNLIAFYSKVAEVLHYTPELLELINEQLRRSPDRCRMEVIYDVVKQYLNYHQLQEQDAKQYTKKRF